MCVRWGTGESWSRLEVRGHLVGVDFLLPPWCSWNWYWTWLPQPLRQPTGPTVMILVRNHSSLGYLDLAGFCICAQSWRMQCICKTVLKYISNWRLWGIFQGVCEQRDIQVSKGRGLWAQNFIFVYLLILKKKVILSIYFACMPSVLRGQRRTTLVLWNWSDRQLCFVRWILGIETRSSAKALIHLSSSLISS